VAVPFVILGFILSWLIKEIPLRTTAFVATTGPDGNTPSSDGTNGKVADETPASSVSPLH
jgi:hypothetical protein